jgi:hypothetical protein
LFSPRTPLRRTFIDINSLHRTGKNVPEHSDRDTAFCARLFARFFRHLFAMNFTQNIFNFLTKGILGY